jgi:hypothetical protein
VCQRMKANPSIERHAAHAKCQRFFTGWSLHISSKTKTKTTPPPPAAGRERAKLFGSGKLGSLGRRIPIAPALELNSDFGFCIHLCERTALARVT